MNVFEKWTGNIWELIDGYNLIRQAGLEVEATYDFNLNRTCAEEYLFGAGAVSDGSPNFFVPMWFLRGLRKHLAVFDYTASGYVIRHWIFSDGTKIHIKKWGYGGKNFRVTLAVRRNNGLLYFTADTEGRN